MAEQAMCHCCNMWELVDTIEVHGDHICSKCPQLEELWLRVDVLKSELQTLRHIREGESRNEEILMVRQSPPHLSATEGDSVTMTCWINSSSADLRIEWSKVLQEEKLLVLTSKGNNTMASLNYTERTQHFFNDTVSSLTISHISMNDTGRYLCEVFIEIPPPVCRKSGNGTNLQVQVVLIENATSLNDSTADSTRWILISSILSIALVVAIITFFVARRLIQSKNEEPVYVNVKYRNKAAQNNLPTETKKCELYAINSMWRSKDC
uniref:uncharacterized protein n=1 Tax=Pristiophorus japonicus TaxID=55135 RepID=UPI00398F8999